MGGGGGGLRVRLFTFFLSHCVRAAPEPVRVLLKLKIDQRNFFQPNDPRQKVMKKVLITIALAGLAMRSVNVLAGGSMSMCDGTKIYAECSLISSSAACSADANCEWDGSVCSASSALDSSLMPTTEDIAAAITIGITCSTASSCAGNCETKSDGTCVGTKDYYKSLMSDDAMAVNMYLQGKCSAIGESECVTVSDCKWDASDTSGDACGVKDVVIEMAMLDECNFVVNGDGTVTKSAASATTSIIAVLISTVAAFLL